MASMEEVATRKVLELFESDKKGNERYLELFEILSEYKDKVEFVVKNRTLDMCLYSIEKMKSYE